jgi:hypothetical protein
VARDRATVSTVSAAEQIATAVASSSSPSAADEEALSGAVSPAALLERSTEIDGETGGVLCGLPVRSTCSQRSARTSSVRAPVSRESTT